MAENRQEVDRKWIRYYSDSLELLLITGMSHDNVYYLIGLLLDYFRSCRPYKLILHRLHEVHGITRSMTWLKKQLKRLNLYRRKVNYTPITVVKNSIRCELRTANSSVGYRALWHILKQKYQLIVKRDTVMILLRKLDKDNVSRRKKRRLRKRMYLSRGPGFAWHLDGYDKLSPFHFYIHGCVDGFSRKIMWLKVASTNKSPGVILQYYLEAINKANGCPSIVQLDCGTEHVRVASTQYALREHHQDAHAGSKSFRYGKSTSNTRIESMWSQLRKHTTGWWISAFKEMEMQGILNTNIVIQRKCLAVIFKPLLQQDLNQFVLYWNSHKIRESRQWNCIGGIPDDLYDMPDYYGTRSYLQSIDPDIWYAALMTEASSPPPMYDNDFDQQCYQLVLNTYGLDIHKDITHSNSLEVYKFLLSQLCL